MGDDAEYTTMSYMCFVLFAIASELARNHPKPQPTVCSASFQTDNLW